LQEQGVRIPTSLGSHWPRSCRPSPPHHHAVPTYLPGDASAGPLCPRGGGGGWTVGGESQRQAHLKGCPQGASSWGYGCWASEDSGTGAGHTSRCSGSACGLRRGPSLGAASLGRQAWFPWVLPTPLSSRLSVEGDHNRPMCLPSQSRQTH
jgi:hypothetical protein